jgi:hypothetical protein
MSSTVEMSVTDAPETATDKMVRSALARMFPEADVVSVSRPSGGFNFMLLGKHEIGSSPTSISYRQLVNEQR